MHGVEHMPPPPLPPNPPYAQKKEIEPLNVLAAGNGIEANRVGTEKVTASTMHQHQVVCVEKHPFRSVNIPTALLLLLLRVLTSVCCHSQVLCVCVDYVKLIKWFCGIQKGQCGGSSFFCF